MLQRRKAGVAIISVHGLEKQLRGAAYGLRLPEGLRPTYELL